MLEQVQQRRLKKKTKYAIGVDRDQSDLAPKNVLTSAIKRVDVGVYETVKDLLDGKFEGGTVTVYGLDQDAVGIAPTTKKLSPTRYIRLCKSRN